MSRNGSISCYTFGEFKSNLDWERYKGGAFVRVVSVCNGLCTLTAFDYYGYDSEDYQDHLSRYDDLAIHDAEEWLVSGLELHLELREYMP